MAEYKGIYYNDKKDVRFFEGGAHFRYKDLVRVLESLGGKIQSTSSSIRSNKFLPKPKTRNVFINENNNNINISLANKTNTYLICNKNISFANKSSLSSEKKNKIIYSRSQIKNNNQINKEIAKKRKDILVNINQNSISNISNTISLRKHSLNNSNSGNAIVFPNYNISRNMRMKSVEYDNKMKWDNITEHKKNDISYIRANGARSIDLPRNKIEAKKISFIRENSKTGNDAKYNMLNKTNLYLKKKTGDFYLKNITRNRENYNPSISLRGASQNRIQGRNIYFGSVIGHHIINDKKGFTFRKNCSNTVYYK